MTASSALCGLLLCEDARGGMSLGPRLCWAQGLIIISLLYKSSLKTPWGKSKKCNQCKARDLIREGANSKSPKFLLLHTTTTITTSYFTKSKIHFDYQRIIFQGKKGQPIFTRPISPQPFSLSPFSLDPFSLKPFPLDLFSIEPFSPARFQSAYFHSTHFH